MSWETYRRRESVIDGVLEDVAASGDVRISDKWQPEIEETFGGVAGFAGALYPRWFAALTARLDQVLQDQPADLPDAAARVAVELAREQPALFAVLASCSGHPALEAARQRERRYLGWAPGAQLAALASRRDDLLPLPAVLS
jgi:hypothetical protein